MTFEVILLIMKYLRIHNNSFHINLYQNQLINECVHVKLRLKRGGKGKTGFFRLKINI